jgi:hypothetical protein
MMDARGQSDRPIAPGKPSDKTEEPAVEMVEGGELAKGHLPQRNATRTPSRKARPVRCSEDVKQRREIGCSGSRRSCTTCTDVERLRTAYCVLKRDAAAGVRCGGGNRC